MGRHPVIQSNLTQEDLRERLNYDADTGEFTWLKPASTRLTPGSRAGYVNTKGYHKIRVGYIKYSAHRLAWFYAHGRWPKEEIDHVNGDKADNRLANLREVTHAQNMQNLKRADPLPCGVRRARSKFAAFYGGKYLGTYASPDAAHAAYRLAWVDAHDEPIVETRENRSA